MKPLELERLDTPTLMVRGAPDTRAASGWRVGLCCLLSAIGISASGQYAIDCSTIDGGGGTSTGGLYSVSGTIGQPDAGPTMSGGPYAMTGGFWALPQAVQTPGAPVLSITAASPGFATISWTPDTGTNWVLQETVNLTTPAWINSPTGTNNPALVPATLPTKFYRLHKP